jgi:hypothetical protein
MKRIVRNNRIIVIAFFTVFTVSAAKATPQNERKEFPAELKYAGDVNEQPLYKVVIAGNTTLDEFTVNIRDEHSNILFSENIKAENFSKSFLLNTDEIADDTIRFEIINRRTKKSVAYEINRYSHLENAMAE